jgi:hypothetical protein
MTFLNIHCLGGASLLGAAVLLAAGSAAANGSGSGQVLRLNGIGPLHLGMTQAEAVATGWLAKPTTGCELAGTPLPVVYNLTGPKAPAGIKGIVEFNRGTLRVFAFSAGVKTTFGIAIPGSTANELVNRARAAGLSATSTYDKVFDGRFVTVKQNGKQVLGAFAPKSAIATIAVPYVPLCE